jgi:ElaB/YqjD/DUF883 family membrane-anchored ribosome-binding protein
MSTSKEYNELILDLLKEQGKDISDIKEDIAQLKTAKHVVKDYKEWRGKVDDVWSPPQMLETKREVYIQKEQWTKTIGILIGVELVVGIILFFLK